MRMKEIKLGTTHQASTTVTAQACANVVGSGDVAVYATPMMIALMEQAAKEAVKPFLEEDETTVGVQMNVSHDAPTPIGMKVIAKATITKVDRRMISYEVIAEDECGVIGKGVHQRVVVGATRFLEKCNAKCSQ